MGYSYNQKEKYYKAIECYRKALKLDKNHAEAWNGLGYAYARVEDYRQSLSSYEKALALEPGNETYRKNVETAKKRS